MMPQRERWRHVVTLVLTVAPATAFPFELPTHGAMTAIAVATSRFGAAPVSNDLLRQLGIVDFPLSFGQPRYPPFGNSYLDMAASLKLRSERGIEDAVIDRLVNKSGLAIPDTNSLGGWIIRGAIREDDNEISNGPNAEPELKSDEPGGVFNRVFGHFFDPKNNAGLSVAGIPIQPRAVDWALVPGAAVNMPAPRENHYKVGDAREAMWRALTLTRVVAGSVTSDGVVPTDIAGTNDAEKRENARKAYWATMFRALGDSVHLLQDMAQPQHTRNDWHSGLGCVPGIACALGHASFFENYLQARTLREYFFELKEGFTRPPNASPPIRAAVQPLDYTGYGSPPMFNSYADLFASATGGDNGTGKGLANYSNRGFYSFGTNIGSVRGSSYPSPSPNGSGLNTELVTYPDLKDIAGNTVNGYAKFKTGTVLDTATGIPEDNVKLATVGPWDQFLQQKSADWSGATLNHYNYDDQARLLVPMAVAYSAGFINYFFRGSMQISLPDDGVYAVMDQSQFSPASSSSGFTKVKLKIANTTPAIGTGSGSAQDMTGGRLVAVAKFRRAKTTYSTDLSGDCGAPNQSYPACRGDVEDILVSTAVTLPDGSPVPSATLVSGAAPQEFHFTFSEAIPLNVTDLYLQVVYRGALGSEADAVVVTTKNVPEPTYLSILNLTDSVACYKGGWVRLNADGSVPAATAATIVADGYNPASLAPQSFVRSSVTFKGPFTYPLSANGPLATTNNIAPGSFYRLAVLTDDQKVFDYDIQNYQFYAEKPLTTAANSIDYDTGTPNTMSSALTKVRDASTFVYRFGYRYLGADCANTANPPLEAAAADGGTFATPTLVPVSTIAF